MRHKTATAIVEAFGNWRAARRFGRASDIQSRKNELNDWLRQGEREQIIEAAFQKLGLPFEYRDNPHEDWPLLPDEVNHA